MEKRKRSGNNAKESRRWSGEGHRISAFRPEITNSYSIEFLSFFIVSIYVCASSLLHYHYIPYSLYHQLWIKSTRYTYSYNFAPNEIPRERERESMWNRLHVSPKLTVES